RCAIAGCCAGFCLDPDQTRDQHNVGDQVQGKGFNRIAVFIERIFPGYTFLCVAVFSDPSHHQAPAGFSTKQGNVTVLYLGGICRWCRGEVLRELSDGLTSLHIDRAASELHRSRGKCEQSCRNHLNWQEYNDAIGTKGEGSSPKSRALSLGHY